MFQKGYRKLQKDGPIAALKAVGRFIHYKSHQTDWDFIAIPALLEKAAKQKLKVSLIQIGANVGDTGSDPLYKFLKKHCLGGPDSMKVECHAVMIEPVRHLFEQLRANYASFPGVACEDVAIADSACIRNFYRLREGIDLQAHGLPPWAEELGSFIPEQMESLWGHDSENLELIRFAKENIVVDEVRCISIHELLEKHNLTEVDLLQVDTEGYDFEILKTIDFKRFKPHYINYERIHLKKVESRCRSMLLNQGYRLRDHGQDTLCERTNGLGFVELMRERLYCAWLTCVF